MQTNKKTYIAGPMTGIKDFNYPAFFKMEEILSKRMAADLIENPARNPKDPNKTDWSEFMRDAIIQLAGCQQSIFLNGWEKSKGARFEMEMCRTIGIDCFDEELNKMSETVLVEANALVSGDRGADYGHPAVDFTRTGKIWAAILGVSEVTPQQVALCMIGLKMSRLCNKYKRDSVVDIAGYAKTMEMIDNFEKLR